MPTLDAFDSFLFSLSTSFCSPLAVFVQIQGCLICLTLAIGWAFAAYVRNREINRMKDSVGMVIALPFFIMMLMNLSTPSRSICPECQLLCL